MAPRIDPILRTSAVPVRADVVVIGGGIVGASTALSLAERGVSVALCEKGRIAGEQSSRNWGWCRVMGRDAAEIPLALESLRLWERMQDRTGVDVGFRRTGILYLCETSQEAGKHTAWLEHARPFQVDSRLIVSEEIEKLLPGAARRWPAALYTASDGRAEPASATSAVANAAIRLGAVLLEDCAVRGLETTGGRVSGVITERGPVACDAVVLAGGAWTRLFCGNLNVRFPQLKVLNSVMRTGPVIGAPETAAGASNFAFRKRLDGGYTVAPRNADIADIVPDSFRLMRDFLPALATHWRELRLRVGKRFLEEWRIPRRWRLDEISPFERVRALDPEPSETLLDEGYENLVRNFPVFRGVTILERWAGLIDVTPDAVPVISDVPALPGFFIASGFSGHGFGIGPGAGQLMADLVTGRAPIVDPQPFRYERL